MTNRAVFLILGLVIIGIAFAGFYFFQQYQGQQTEIQKLEAIAEKERQKARQAEEARKEQEERKLAEERRKQAERERIRRLERERQIEKEKEIAAETRRQKRLEEERKRTIDLALLPDMDSRPCGFCFRLPNVKGGDKIEFLDNLVVKADQKKGGSVALGGRQIVLRRGTDKLFIKKGSVYEVKVDSQPFLSAVVGGNIISADLPKVWIKKEKIGR